MRILLICILFFTNYNLFSQNFIGFRNSIFYHFNNEKSFELDSYSSLEVRPVRDIDIDFFLIEQKEKFNIKYQIGYRQFSSYRNRSESLADNSIIIYSQRKIIRLHALFGINNYIDLKPLRFFYGVEFPFSYELKTKDVNSTIRMNENTVDSYESIFYTPQQFHFGINLDFKIYYFYKRIGVGIELLNGFQLQTTDGEFIIENNLYDSNNVLIDSEIFTELEKRSIWLKRSFVSIGIMYQFQKSEK